MIQAYSTTPSRVGVANSAGIVKRKRKPPAKGIVNRQRQKRERPNG